MKRRGLVSTLGALGTERRVGRIGSPDGELVAAEVPSIDDGPAASFGFVIRVRT